MSYQPSQMHVCHCLSLQLLEQAQSKEMNEDTPLSLHPIAEPLECIVKPLAKL